MGFWRDWRENRAHQWVIGHANEYLDDELSESGRMRVEEHTSICPECRHFVRTLIATVKQLAGLKSDVSAPSTLADDCIEKLRSERRGGYSSHAT